MGKITSPPGWQQLPLDIGLAKQPSFDNYIAGRNRLHVLQLQAWCAGTSEPVILLLGSRGEGVSHLLQSCYHVLEQGQQPVVYLSLAHDSLEPEQLVELAVFDYLCLDDLQAVMGDPVWERELFHLFNLVRAQNSRLLLGGKEALADMPLNLPDLKSRLSWGLTLVLQPLSDQQKVSALQTHASERGLELSHDLALYILHRSGRSLGELMVVLDQLDQASMRTKRRLTLSFVRQEMGW